MKKGMFCNFYVDKAGKWRWRLLASNGRIVADSGQGYTTKANAVRMITRIVQAAKWDLVDVTPA